MMSGWVRGAIAAAMMTVGLGVPVMAQNSGGESAGGSISLELNKLETTDGGCRAYMVLRNPTDVRYEKFNLELLIFDVDGVISKRLAVPFEPLRANKTSVSLFDMSGLDCAKVGELLLNDFFDCETAEGGVPGCLDKVTLSSRADARFYK